MPQLNLRPIGRHMFYVGDLFDLATLIRRSDQTLLVAHVVNTAGRFSAGFAGDLARKYPVAKEAYLEWAAGRCETPFVLGRNLVVEVEPKIWVVHMLAQVGVRRGGRKIRYDALGATLLDLGRLYETFHEPPITVTMPKIGCGIGKGDWGVIGELIGDCLPPARCVVCVQNERELP